MRRSRLLLAYVALGILSGFGSGGLPMALANYALLGIYVLVIYLLTERIKPTVGKVDSEDSAIATA